MQWAVQTKNNKASSGICFSRQDKAVAGLGLAAYWKYVRIPRRGTNAVWPPENKFRILGSHERKHVELLGAGFSPITARAGIYGLERGDKRYELSNHLGNVLAVVSDRRAKASCADTLVSGYWADIMSTTDYYPFGMGMVERGDDGGYRYGFNGQERDDEVSGGGNSYTAEFWQYDSRLGRRWNVDPKGNISCSPFSTFLNNPLIYSDPKGDTVRVTTNSGHYLFSLDDGRTQILSVTAKQLYDAGYQWSEPFADNYLPLIDVNSDIVRRNELRHFTWDQIAGFSNGEFNAFDFRNGGYGDWKESPEGANGFFLVTVDGEPFWADAIGQIPFAVWFAKSKLKEHGNADKTIIETLNKERDYGEGKIIFGNRDNDNGYDHFFAYRGAKAVTEAFKVNKDGELILTKGFRPANSSLSRPVDKDGAEKIQETADFSYE